MVLKLGIPSFLLSIMLAIFAYWQTGYWQSLQLSISSVLLGFSIAVLMINGFMNIRERKKSALVLLKFIHKDVATLYNLSLEKGRDKFGLEDWNSVVEAVNNARRDKDSLSPEKRNKIIEILSENEQEIDKLTSSIDDLFREVTYIIGWNFHPKITRDCLQARMEISRYKSLWAEGIADEESKKEIAMLFFAFNANSGAVLDALGDMLGIKTSEN